MRYPSIPVCVPDNSLSHRHHKNCSAELCSCIGKPQWLSHCICSSPEYRATECVHAQKSLIDCTKDLVNCVCLPMPRRCTCTWVVHMIRCWQGWPGVQEPTSLHANWTVAHPARPESALASTQNKQAQVTLRWVRAAASYTGFLAWLCYLRV
jgi:hypothetical protein